MKRFKKNGLEFTKSSFSGGDKYCVGVCIDRERVVITNTNDPKGPTIEYSIREWEVFVKGVKNDEFDVVSGEGPVRHELQ